MDNWNAELESMAANGVIPYPEWRRKQLEANRQPGLIDYAMAPVSKGLPAVKQMAQDPYGSFVQPMIDMAMYPGEVLQGRKKVTDSSGRTSDEAIQMGMDIAGGLTGQGLVRRGTTPDATQAGIFGGEKAVGAPLRDLQDAKQLEKEGVDKEVIWMNTGWFKGGDGRWRFEIDDSRIGLNTKAFKTDKNKAAFEKKKDAFRKINKEYWDEYDKPKPGDPPTNRLAELQRRKDMMLREMMVSAPEGLTNFEDLARYYPELRNIVMDRWAMGKGTHGGQSTEDWDLELNSHIPLKNQNDTIIHELQHFVQDLEGHAPGGNPVNIGYSGPDKAHERALLDNDVAQKIDDWWAERKTKPTGGDLLEMESQSQFDMYKALLGETEARAASDRRNMNLRERRNTFPEKSYDNPYVIIPREMNPPMKGRIMDRPLYDPNEINWDDPTGDWGEPPRRKKIKGKVRRRKSR